MKNEILSRDRVKIETIRHRLKIEPVSDEVFAPQWRWQKHNKEESIRSQDAEKNRRGRPRSTILQVINNLYHDSGHDEANCLQRSGNKPLDVIKAY